MYEEQTNKELLDVLLEFFVHVLYLYVLLTSFARFEAEKCQNMFAAPRLTDPPPSHDNFLVLKRNFTLTYLVLGQESYHTV
jgi:hypothetical protein